MNMLMIDKTVHDRDLLDTYIGQPCILTEDLDTHAHHRCKRSKLHLDVPENLVVLKDSINDALEMTKIDFCVYMNGEYYEIDHIIMWVRFYKATGFKPKSWGEVYDWLTDADNAIYNKYAASVLINEPKQKSKIKIPSRPFGSKKSKYKKKVDGSIVLR